MRMPRIKLALARGEASSAGAVRKIGHIRTCGDCVRQSPQPVHCLHVSATSDGIPIQLQLDQVAQARLAVVAGAPRRAGSRPGSRSPGGSLRTSRSGSAPMIFPGLRMLAGSKTCLICRRTS